MRVPVAHLTDLLSTLLGYITRSRALRPEFIPIRPRVRVRTYLVPCFLSALLAAEKRASRVLLEPCVRVAIAAGRCLAITLLPSPAEMYSHVEYQVQLRNALAGARR